MRALLRLVLFAAGTAGLVVTFREETQSKSETGARQGIEKTRFRERTEIGLAFSPWYVRTTDTDRDPVVEEEIKPLSWSVFSFLASLALVWWSYRLGRHGAGRTEDATW